MSAAIRGSEPPFLGAVYEACTGSGRRWEVQERHSDDEWTLRPMGDDIEEAKRSQRFDGIPSRIVRSSEQLRDRKKWRMRGVTSRATAA